MVEKPLQNSDRFGVFCDRGIVFSICTLIFVLPASIALLNSFAAMAIFLYLLKRINRIVIEWPLKAARLNCSGKIHFVWKGFAPAVNVLNRPLQFLSLAIFISVLFSQYPMLSLSAFGGKFLKVVFLYFSFIEVFIDEKRIRMFVNFFLAAAFITALIGIVQHFTNIDFLKGKQIVGGRINSFFYTANGLGAYLLPVIGMAAHFLYTAIVRQKSWILGVIFTIFLVSLSVCLCWSYSRSAWVGYLFILFIMGVMDRRKALFAVFLFLIFIFIFLPSLSNVRHLRLISDHSSQKVQNTITDKSGGGVQKFGIFQKIEADLKQGPIHSVKCVLEQGVGSGRSEFWKKAISIIRSSPICGTGFNTYTRVLMQDPDRNTWWYAHNSYLQMAAETGLVGLACFLWMIFVLLRYGVNYCKQLKGPWMLSLLQGTLSGLFGFLAQSFFDNTFFVVQLSVLMWMIFGLMVAVTRAHSTIRDT